MEDHLYFMQVLEGEITVFMYEEGKFGVLRRNGECTQVYDVNTFWDWWKDKQAYHSEAVSLIVSTDVEMDFFVPEDVFLAKENSGLKVVNELVCFLNNNSLLQNIQNIETFPLISHWEKLIKPLEEKINVFSSKQDEFPVKNTGLKALYRKRTEGYKHGR